MTDPVTILATISITTAIAFPVGVAAGRRQERDRWERSVAKRARELSKGSR